MTRPKRVKVAGDLYHGVVPDGATYVGRPTPGLPGSPYANPHKIGKPCGLCGGREHSRAQAVAAYRRTIKKQPELLERARKELRGKDLACWCPLTEDCHAEALIEIVNGRA
jgi:hypothetical protein